jgi:hypothetical protein
MSQQIQIELKEASTYFPADITQWIDKHEISAIIPTELSKAQNSRRDFGVSQESRGSLLALIVYSYLMGIYSSEEIASTCTEWQGLEDFRTFPPESHEIRRFRRNHRFEIEECLGEALKRIWIAHSSLGDDHLWNKQNQTGNTPFMAEEVYPFSNEARSRINKAIQLDCWACDW